MPAVNAPCAPLVPTSPHMPAPVVLCYDSLPVRQQSLWPCAALPNTSCTKRTVRGGSGGLQRGVLGRGEGAPLGHIVHQLPSHCKQQDAGQAQAAWMAAAPTLWVQHRAMQCCEQGIMQSWRSQSLMFACTCKSTLAGPAALGSL